LSKVPELPKKEEPSNEEITFTDDMPTKTFSLKWKGKDATITYKTDLAFGDMEQIRKDCIKQNNMGMPTIDYKNYRMMIALKSLIAAPFTISVHGMNALPSKVIDPIYDRIMSAFPLWDSVVSVMKTAFADQIDIQRVKDWITSQTKPTGSVPSPSDGTSDKSTNSPPDT